MAPRKPKNRKPGEATYQGILREHDVASHQRTKRVELLRELSSEAYNGSPGPHAVVAHLSSASLEAGDLAILANVLLEFGDVKTLNLVLESPGGDGTQVEKFVALCRNQCERFRVIIPNEAKSAATLVALGADQIVMGPTSELGPIDAQIPVNISGFPRYMSAQSFVDARDNTLLAIDERKRTGQDIDGQLQLLSTLDLPFIAECERLMEFGRDVGEQLLSKHMFAADPDPAGKAKSVVANFSSVAVHKVHGRLINGPMAKTLGLNVQSCGRSDPFWKLVMEYYQRARVSTEMDRSTKMFETEHNRFAAKGRS